MDKDFDATIAHERAKVWDDRDPMLMEMVRRLSENADTVERLEARLAALEAVRTAADAMAESVDELLASGMEMKPHKTGQMTFEAMLMLVQMLGVHRETYRAAVAALDGAEEGQATPDET
jgi:hypothetical protein